MDVQETNRRVIEQFRAGGEIEGMHRDRLLLLTTTGAKTGLHHTTPMMFHREGDRLFVIASNMGAPKTPDWYSNLVVEPRVTVELADESYDAVATPVTRGERDRLWETITAAYPFFTEHEASAGHTIPLVEITRASSGA